MFENDADGLEKAGRADWEEERLRYLVLLKVHERAGGLCERVVTGSAIGADLNLRYEDLYRVIHYLEYNGYLDYLDAGPRVCLTQKGVAYLTEIARRRRSIRNPRFDGSYQWAR